MASRQYSNFLFPRWGNYLLPALVVGVVGGALYAPVVVTFGFSPTTLFQNYQPEQPVEYSHALHAGQLGIDCRYCHSTVEDASFAAIPHTEVCINCHNPGSAAGIRKKSPKLAEVHESYSTGMPIEWTKVNVLPDYAYFNHAAHVNKGVGCVSCHGRVDTMEKVYMAKPLSMSWCLECHREPEKFLRPVEEVTNMTWTPPVQGGESLAAAQLRLGKQLKEQYNIRGETYMTNCSTCHR